MAVEFLFICAPLLLSLIMFLGFWNIGNTDTKYPKLPPGSLGGLPLIGDTIPFMQPHSSASLGDFLEQHIARYGRIFRMNYLGKATIVSADPELNRFILQNEGKLFSCSYPTGMKKILGRWSMLSLTGDAHREMRSIATGFMSNAKLRTFFLSDIDRQVADILGSWPENTAFSAYEECKKFAFNLMVKQLMNMYLGSVETQQLRKEYITFLKGMASIPINLPGTAYRKALQSRSVILKIMGKKLDERVKSIEDGIQGVEEDDLLASVVKNQNIRREQILDLILSMLFAGHETSSAALSLAIYFLQASPKAFQELRKEHTEIGRQKMEMGEKQLNWDDYKKMAFINCVINETLRLGNIVKFLHREAIRDVQFKGYDIPSGWKIIPILSAAHLDPSIYEDPQQFNPWRWQKISSTPSKNNSVMSFSGGPRYCPGAELAKLKMAIFLHYLVQKYEWELAEKDCPISFPFLHFPNGLPIKVHRL